MQLLYPEFLWGLLAIGIPIAIHLLQLRRPQRLLFTNTSFIREVELVTMRRRRVQELLVLVARVLGISFLVLVFAQPFIPARQSSSQGSDVHVLVDNSPSMHVAGEVQGTLMQQAVEQAQALGRSYGTTTHFKLIGQKDGELTQSAYLDRLAEAPVLSRRNNWASARAQQQLQKAGQNSLYMFSDFQRSVNSEKMLKNIATDAEVVLVPQVGKQVANIYVDSVWLDDAFVRIRTNVGLHIRLRNGGQIAMANCPVKVRLGTQQVAAFSVSLESGQATTSVVQVQVPDTRLALGEVATGDNPVTFDNIYYFTLQPTASIRVLEIGTEPVAQKAYSAEALFAYSFAMPKQLNYNELRRANIVLVNGTASIDIGLREALIGVVRRGGSVVVVPPSAVTERTAALQLLKALGISGIQWEDVPTGSLTLQEVAMPSGRDPFFRDVFGAQARQVVMPQVAPVLRIDQSGVDILRLRNGDSYLAEFKNVGLGKAYIFTAPFAKAYGDFTTQGLFVPVLYRLAMLSYHTNQRFAYRLNEPTIMLDMQPQITANSEYRLVRDSLTLLPTQRLREAKLQLEIPAEMTQPGFYELRHRGQLVTTLAFNADKEESELKVYSAAELRQLVGPDRPNVRVLDGTASPVALTRYRAEQTGQPLWRYCLFIVLGCLLLEGLLLRFGRSKASPRPMRVA
jgi:hypothetical protein